MTTNSEIGKMKDFNLSVSGIHHFGGTMYHACIWLRSPNYDSFMLSVIVDASSFADVPEKARLEVVRFARDLLQKASEPLGQG